MKSVLSKTSGFLYEWQWKRLWRLLASGCGGLFLYLVTIDGEEADDLVCF